MRFAVAIAGLPADPYSIVLAHLDWCGRDVVCPQIECAAGAQVKAGVMPVASQNAVFNRAAVQWEAEMGTAIVEREDMAAIVHYEQRTRAAGGDHHPLGLQLVKVPTRISSSPPTSLACLRTGSDIADPPSADHRPARPRPARSLAAHCCLRRLRVRGVRQVPARVATFEATGPAMALQGNTEMIRPDRHAELALQVSQNFSGRGACPMRLDCLQGCVAQRQP